MTNAFAPSFGGASTDLSLGTRQGLPDDLKLLVALYPRDIWTGHAKLGEMAKFWLARHTMFRELGSSLGGAGDRFRDEAIDAREFVSFFAPRLQFFLQQLHAHHHVEDDHYFPIFRRAESKLARGFEILESDHDAIAVCIENSVTAADTFLQALEGPPAGVKQAAMRYAQSGDILLRSLLRHLDDEEDLIVPLILDRGEDSLGLGH